MIRHARALRDDVGANLIETAIVLPILLMLLFSLVEFAVILYFQMALQNGVNQGARFAITRSLVSGLNREQSIRRIIKDETPTITLSDGQITFQHMALGASTWQNGTGPANSVERVTVTYPYPVISPAMRPFLGGNTVTLRAQSTMKNESELGP